MVPLLFQNIDRVLPRGDGSPYSDETVSQVRSRSPTFSSASSTIKMVRFKSSATVDTKRRIDCSAAAAGAATNETCGFNSSYILAKVVDDDNLCVILHRLRDPNLGYSGQVNLLQIAISGTSSAARENVQAAKETAERLKTRTEENPRLRRPMRKKSAFFVNLLDSDRKRQRAMRPSRCLQTVSARVTMSIRGLPAPHRPKTPPATPSP